MHTPDDLLGALIHPDHQPRTLTQAQHDALIAAHGRLDLTAERDGLHYHIRSTQLPNGARSVTARRITPPRHDGEIIIRTAVRADQVGLAGALIGGRVLTATVRNTSPALLYARAIRLALKRAPDGPVTLLSSNPITTRLLHAPNLRAREHRHLQQALNDHPHAISVHLISKATGHLLRFSDQDMGLSAALTQPERLDVTCHTDDTHVHVQCAGIHVSAAIQPHVPPTLTGLHALLGHLPHRTAARIRLPPAARAAYTHPAATLGPDATLVHDIHRYLHERRIDLKIR